MNRTLIDEFYRDPALRHRLFADAHRERSRTIHAGLNWLGRRIAALARNLAHARFRIRPMRWTERLG